MMTKFRWLVLSALLIAIGISWVACQKPELASPIIHNENSKSGPYRYVTIPPARTLTQSQIDVLLYLAEENLGSQIENLKKEIEWYLDPTGILIDEETERIMTEKTIQERIVEFQEEIDILKALRDKLTP
jgi:hypothetical protein